VKAANTPAPIIDPRPMITASGVRSRRASGCGVVTGELYDSEVTRLFQ
jgi:hypothetical protein